MTKSENKLLSLLFEDGRVLENIKFFPGAKCASAQELFEEAYAAISDVLQGRGQQIIPADGAAKTSFGELMRSI